MRAIGKRALRRGADDRAQRARFRGKFLNFLKTARGGTGPPTGVFLGVSLRRVRGGTSKPTQKMKTYSLPSLILATALLGGLALTARADSSQPPELPAPARPAPAATDGQGLLGQVYGTLTYSYVNLESTSVHTDSYNFEMNQPLSFGLDGFLGYDYSRSGNFGAAGRYKSDEINAGLRAFSSHYNWGKPYVEAGIGYGWTRFAGTKDRSLFWEVAVGTEFQVLPTATVTPYVRYADKPDLAGGNIWSGGVKGNYWVTPQWSVTAGLERDDNHSTTATVGTNFRF